MAQITHNIDIANSGNGEKLRTAFDNQNLMNTELYTTKVDKVTGKDLSETNFTQPEKTKLLGIAADAEKNVQANLTQNDVTADDYVIGKEQFLPESDNSKINKVSRKKEIVTVVTSNLLPIAIGRHYVLQATNNIFGFTNVPAGNLNVNLPFYDGESVFITNDNATDVTLTNQGVADIPFLFYNSVNFLLKPKQTVEFVYNGLVLGYVGVITDTTKQDVLVSGTNIKTVNGSSVLGSGNLAISGGATSIFFDKNFPIVTTDTTQYWVGPAMGFTTSIDAGTGITTASALIESVSTGASQGRLLKLPFNAKVKSVMFTTGDARSLGTLEILVWSNKVNDGQSFDPPVALTEGLIITNKSITLTYGVYKTNIYEGVDLNSATISKGNFLYFAIKGGPFPNGIRNCNLSILIEQV